MFSISFSKLRSFLFCSSQNCQDKLVGSGCTENRPLDISSIIASDGAGKDTGHSAVEKVEIWVNGVKRVIFVPLGNNPTEPCNPSEPCNASQPFNPTEPCNQTERHSPNEARDSFVAADPNPASPVVAVAKTSSCSSSESCSRSTVVTCSAGENTVLSKSVSTNTVDQLPNRCVATVAPQINHELGRLLVSSAFDDASKSKEFSIKPTAAFIKQEKLTSSTNCLNVRPESVEALSLGANISQKQPFIHQRQHLTDHQRLLNVNEWRYQDRYNHLQRLGYDEPGRLPTTHGLTRNTAPRAGLPTYVTESSSAPFALPNTVSFTGHHRLPTMMAPYLLHPIQATVLASNSLGPSVSIPGRAESNHFSSVLGMNEPAVGSNEICSNRSAQVPVQVPNAPPHLGKPAVMVPNFPLQRYQHLLATLDPTKQPHSYGRFGAQDDAQLHNVYAPLARFPTRRDFPYPQFPVRLPISEQVAQVTSFNNGHRFFSHHPNYISSFVHAENQARHELHVPSSIASFNQQPSRIYLSETGQHVQSIGIGQAAHTPLNFKQPEAVPGGNLTLQRVPQNQPNISSAVPEMSQMYPLPPSYLHYANLQGCEQVPSLRMLRGTEQSALHVQNLVNHRLPSAAIAQPGLAHRETIQSSIFQQMNREIAQSSNSQPVNRFLYNNACPPRVPQFMRAPHESTAISQNVVSCSQTDSLSQCVTVPGLRLADEQNGSSSNMARHSSPSVRATLSQNLVSQSFLSASPVVPLRSVSQNLPAGYSQRFFSFGEQTIPYLQKLPVNDTSKSQSGVDVEDREATGLQSHAPSICNSIQVEDTFRNCYSNRTETDNRTIPVLPSCGASRAICDPQPPVSTGIPVSMTLTSMNKGGEKSLDAKLADSNNESSKSAEVTFNDKILPLCSSDTVLDASHEALPEITVSPSLKSQLEPSNNLQPSTELQDPQRLAVSLPGSPQSPMSEIMNSMDKISDDLSMQKWLDSLIGNISDSSRDGFDSQAKLKTADLAVVNQTSSKDMTTAAGPALVCRPSMAKQVDVKKSKRTWIGIKSIEAEMSPKSSDVKAKRRKRRRLTMKSNQSPEGSCDASSDSWHPDSFASSESSMDSILTSIPSTQTSCTESSWCSDDSVTIGKRCKKRSRKSVRSQKQTVRSRHRRTRRLHNLSPWCRTRPCFGRIRGCFVSLEVLCLKGETSVNVTRAGEVLCCSSKTKSRTVQSGSDTEDSYGSWCPFKRKKHLLKHNSKRTRNAGKTGSETEDSYSSRQRSKNKNLFVKLRYSKPARNVVMSGSDTEGSCSLEERSKTTRHLLKSKDSKPERYRVKSGSDSEKSYSSWQPSKKKRRLRSQI